MVSDLLDKPAVEPRVGNAAGSGAVELARVAGRTVVTRARANSPLKLLNPRSPGSGAWVFTSTFGGGLVAGDQLSLSVDVGDGCSCLLGTQSATKVYRSPDGRSAGQALAVSVGSDSTCVIAPHPVSCFAQARFVQRQRIELTSGSSLVLIDWLTSGRHAAGERWAFDRYDSRTDVFIDRRHVFRDALLLSAADGPIDVPHRTGGFDCFAYAVVVGAAFDEPARHLLRQIERQPVPSDPRVPLIFAASPLDARGVIVRAAGSGTEIVGRWLLAQLSFVSDVLGSDRWSRMLG
jgi:urease accessory protein